MHTLFVHMHTPCITMHWLQVGYLLQRLLAHRSPVQVAFLQGAIPLQNTNLFARLLDFLQLCPIWSVRRPCSEAPCSEAPCSEAPCSEAPSGARQATPRRTCAKEHHLVGGEKSHTRATLQGR